VEAWIESAAGNLLSASSVNNIKVSETTPGGEWEVSAGTDAKTAPFAKGLASRESARKVRNALAVAIAEACKCDVVQMISYCDITEKVDVEELAA
jgi:hypothetical protein